MGSRSSLHRSVLRPRPPPTRPPHPSSRTLHLPKISARRPAGRCRQPGPPHAPRASQGRRCPSPPGGSRLAIHAPRGGCEAPRQPGRRAVEGLWGGCRRAVRGCRSPLAAPAPALSPASPTPRPPHGTVPAAPATPRFQRPPPPPPAPPIGPAPRGRGSDWPVPPPPRPPAPALPPTRVCPPLTRGCGGARSAGGGGGEWRSLTSGQKKKSWGGGKKGRKDSNTRDGDTKEPATRVSGVPRTEERAGGAALEG